MGGEHQYPKAHLMNLRNLLAASALTLGAIVLPAPNVLAQVATDSVPQATADTSVAATSPSSGSRDSLVSLVCLSTAPERRRCAADTSAGVTLLKAIGDSACLLGKSWGYDSDGVWVSDGCSGEFGIGAPAPPPAATPPSAGQAQTPPTQAPASAVPDAERIETWGEFEPGQGFLVGRSDAGQLEISAYALLRYMNQSPVEQTFVDHLGNERPVDNRDDIYPHRIMVFFKGWLGNPKLLYNIFFWTVNTTDQKNFFASMGYQFTRRFSLYAGLNGLPGTRSLQGSHPYWLGHDRVMADEFFRPYFSNGLWAQGELLPGLWYNVMTSNNLSALGIKANQLDREWSHGASVWWTPTTHEFGPKGAFGDWEMHEKLATRFGFSSSWSPEERYTDANTGSTGNTTIRLADSLNVFDTGALAPGVTVQNVNYSILSFDAGIKYRGFFLQTEIYNRWLDQFRADGALPVSRIHDKGFYVQGAFYPVPKKLEVYGATSHVYGDKAAGFGDSHEVLGGVNVYPFNTRNHRLNLQIMNVDRSPVNSTFGYYTGGQKGTTVATAFSVFF
jgi:hypothetical protein